MVTNFVSAERGSKAIFGYSLRLFYETIRKGSTIDRGIQVVFL